jgi:hypothetical protein
MYRTVWRREADGLAHRATVTGNPTDGYEIRSDCGLIDNASWAAQLDEDSEITCPRCRTIGRAKQAEAQAVAGREIPQADSQSDNPTTDSAPASLFEETDVIHHYTRAEAIRDGLLVDVTAIAKEAGIRYPTALTRAVWDAFVRIPEGVIGQEEQGRLWDVVWLLRHAAKSSRGDIIFFYLHVRNDNHRATRHQLKAICGPDDDGRPCITVLLPTED